MKFENVEQWKNSLRDMNFETYAIAVKDKILESGELTSLYKQQFEDCFNYVLQLYKQGKSLEPNLIKIYLRDVKGYGDISMMDFIKILVLLSYCGFSFSMQN